MNIYIAPFNDFKKGEIEFLKSSLSKIFGSVKVLPKLKVPQSAYNFFRRQYNASLLLENLPIFKDGITLGITSLDIYADNLNFIFGLAEIKGKRALISTYRLDPTFYGESFDKDLYYLRIIKEALHEIGHVLGLPHCENKTCVMSFSNSIFEVDRKSSFYCENCLKKLNIFLSAKSI